MSNDNLKNIYNALVTPSPQTNNKPLFTKDEIGATPEEFAKIMSNSENAKNIYTALTSPIASLGNKPIFTSAEIGDNADAFSSILGIQKKSPIGSVSTSGSKPSQNTSTIIPKSSIKTPKVSIGGDIKNAIISLEGAQMALVNKDKEIQNLDKSISGGRDVGGSFLQQDKNLAKVTSGYKEELTKERQFIEKSVSGVIGRVKPLVNKITDEAITKDNLSGFTKNIEGKIIPDPLKIREYVDDVIAQTGLSEGKYVKDFIYNEVKANVQSKISQPKIEKKFEEIYKSKYGVSPEEAVNKDFAGKFKDDESLQAQAKLKAKEASSLAQTDFNIEMSKYSEEYKKKADAINLNYNTQADNIKKTAEGLGVQYSSGQISKEQYEANINQLNTTLENSFNAYKNNFKLLADEFLKTQNATASRYDRRLQRQYAEIDNSYQTELKNRLKNYQSKYVVPADLKKRYEETYREATQLYNKEEAVADYAVNTYKGGVVTFGESLLSGLGQGIKELSYMADFDLGKKYGEFLETSFRLSESNLESMKDLLDPIKLARSSGQTIGAMTPMIIGNAGVAAATGGASIPVQLAMTGGFGFVMETMQMAGSTYDRKLAETGVVADAEKAAAKVIEGNTMLMPLYAFDGLPLINNATLGIKNRALRALAKGGIETITEFTQEIPQSAIEDVVYKNQNLTDVVDKFDLTKSENRKEIFNTALNVIPASMLMGSAPTFLGYANKPINEIRGRAAFTKEKLEGLTDNALEQFFYDMQLTKGATFAKAFLSGAYASGSVNEMQLIKLTNIVDKSTKVMEDAKALKLSNGESKVYAAYEFAADAYTKQADQMEEGVAKDALLTKAAKAKKEAQEFLTNKKGDYVVLIMPNGEQYVYQSDFFVSSTNNYKTLRKLIIDGNATAYAVASTKEGELIKTKVTGLLKIADKKLQENDSKPSIVIDEELFDKISEEIGTLQLSLEQPSLSPESRQKIQARITELEKQSEMVLKGEEIEYVSEGDNFFKILLDGTKEPISEQEFDQATETVKPINEKNGEIVTVNIGGKAITGTVEVDEGGKATIYSGGTIYELPNDTQYADYASPVRISDIDGSIEFDGISYPEVRIETIDGNEAAVLIDEAGKPKTVKDPEIVEEFKYQITLANLQELTEPEAITLLSEYENSKGKTDAATEEGANQTNEQTEQDIKLQEAIDEIDLIELIALEELENAESEAKLVSYKPVNSKEEKVYLVKKNADGTISATLNGRNVKRPDVLKSIADAYDIQSKEQSKKLVAKLQDQTNKLKAEVEEKLFGKKAETVSVPVEPVSTPVVEVAAPAVEQVAEQPAIEEQVEQEPQTQEQNATQESSQQEVNFGTAFDQQEATAEETVGKNKDAWGGAQVWRERIENAGDILRELSSRGERPDAGYLLEKVNKIRKWISESRKNPPENIPSDINTVEDFNKSSLRFSSVVDGYEYLTKFYSDVLNKIKSEYESIDTYTREQELALNLVLDLLNNNIEGLESKLSQIESLANKIRETKSLPIVKNITLSSDRKLQSPTPTITKVEESKLSRTEAKKREIEDDIKRNEEQIEASERRIENFTDEIGNTKSNLKEDLEALREKRKQIKASKLKGQKLQDALDENESEMEDAKNDADDYIQQYKDDISLEKDDIKRSNKEIAKLQKKLAELDAAEPVEVEAKKSESVKAEKPKVEAQKPVGLTANETKYKENPDALSKDELKDVLDSKRERLKKANAALEKGELSPEETKVKQKAIDSLENTIEDLVKRIDSKSNPIATTKEQLAKVKKEISDYWDGLSDNKLGIAKTPEQMVQSMREDEKFFRAIVDFAYLSIKLKGLKTIEAFKAELEKQLGVKFDKLPQELKDAWAQAKVMVSTEKKQAPTIKQTTKESIEQGTSKEKIATFSDWIKAKYEGMAQGEKIGQANRFKLIEAAVQYVRKAAIEDISKAKIISLVNKAIKVNSYDNVKAFGKFVDKLLENHKYYAKVAELESLLPKLGKKLRNEKLGSIAPQVRRLMIINPENLTEADIDLFIKLTKELLNGDVTNLNSGLEALKASEKTYLENKFIAGLMSDEELMYATNSLEDLQAEANNETLSAMDQKKKSAEYREEVVKKIAMFEKQRELIMEYIRGDRTIKSAKEYVSLVNAVKKQNYALNRLMQNNIISDVQKEQLSIDPTGESLSLIEEALKEKLGDFKKSLSDQIGNIIASLRNQVATGGIRAKLFDNLTDFDKKAYDQTLTDVLTVPLEVLQDLDIVELDAFFNAVEQLNNGYFSPKLLESLEIIESKGFANSIRENADGYYKDQVDAEGKYDAKVSPLLKQVKDFKGVSALAEFMKTLDYKEMASFLSDGFVKMFSEYIYTPFQKAYVFYKNTLEETTEDVVLADDKIESGDSGQVVRNVVGMFLIQADHLRNESYKNWSDDKKNLPQYLIDQNDAGRLDAAQDSMDMLKAAMAEIEGDISTKAGLDAVMNKYFAKNPKAKKLHEAIRKSIDEKVAPMNKISIEREGGYFEPDGDYFPIQRKGAKVQEIENPFEDMMAKKYDKNFKLRNNATYRRVGDPFVMREFNATLAFNTLAEDATRTYALKPIINPYMRAITELANEYDLKGKKELSNFLNASREYMHTSIALQFQRENNSGYFKYISQSAAFQRAYLLAQAFRLLPDYLSNIKKALSTMNPFILSKYLNKQSKEFNKNSFVNLAKAVNSPIIFKTSGVKVENQFMNKRVREKKLDRIAGMADVFAASAVWKALVLKNFKELTGKDLDTKQLENNITEYYLQNKAALNKAAFMADLEIDKRYVIQSEIGRAPLQQVLPFVGGTAKLNKLTLQRTSKALSVLNMMASYVANDSKVLGAASRRLITQGDVSGFIKDVLPILTSQLVYATSMSYMNALASTLGYAVMSAGGDEEDETVLEYFTEEMSMASKFYTDPKEFSKGYLASLLMMATGRYATVSRAAASIGLGLYASADINRHQDKKTRREAVKKWKDSYSITKGQFYFEPMMFGVKDMTVRNTASDLAGLIPIFGFYWKQADFQLDPENPTAIMAAVKELGKEDPDIKNVAVGVSGLALLTGVALGLTITPTILKTASEAAKTKGRRDAEEKKKSKGTGRKDDGFGGFGSDGFSSSKF